MSQTTRSLDESSTITQPFEFGSQVQTKTASSECKLYSFADFQPPPHAPAKTKSISDIVDRWNRDPVRRQGLKRARVLLAELSTSEGDTSVRALRLRAGLSQTDLAKALGTSQPHIARLEAGTSEPTLETCRKLARVLNVDLNAIGQAFSNQGGVD